MSPGPLPNAAPAILLPEREGLVNLVGPVILFILLANNNLPVQAERSAVRTCSTDHFRLVNRTWSRRAKSMKQSTACLLGYNQQYERSAARSCSAECFSLVKREHSKGKKHNDNLYACSSKSQSKPSPPIGVYE